MNLSKEKMSGQKDIALLSLISVIALYFLTLNRYIPMFADDYCRFRNTFDIFYVIAETKNTYYMWSGRFPVMFLNIFFFSAGKFGKFAVELLNGFALGFLCYLATFVIPDRRNISVNACVIVCFLFLLWFTPNNFGEVALWKTGAVQYLWGVLIATICIVPVLRFLIYGKNMLSPRYSMTAYAIVSFLGGAWLEHLSVALALVWLVLLVYGFKIKNEPVPKILVLGFVLWVIGTASLMAAPGNYCRSELLVGMGIEFRSIRKFLSVSWDLRHTMDIKFLILYILFVVISVLNKEKTLQRKIFQSFVFIAVGIISAYVFVGIPVYFIGRVAFPMEYFLVLSVISVFPYEVFRRQGVSAQYWRYFVIGACFIMALLLCKDMKNTLNTYRLVWKQNVEREAIIADAIKKGETDVSIPPFMYGKHYSTRNGEINSDRLFGRDITFDSSSWENECYAKAHGLKSVILGE